MQGRLLSGLLLTALGCGPTAPNTAPAATPALVSAPGEPEATPAPQSAPPTAAAPSASAPEISLASRGTCVLEAPRWSSKGRTTELRLSGDGPVFAELTSPRAALHLPTGKASAGAGLEVENEGLLLRGYVAGDAFTLRPAKAFVMGGFVVPTAFAELVWTEAHENDVLVSYDLGSSVTLIQAPLSAKLACADLTIGSSNFQPEQAARLAKNAKDALLHTGRPIALATELGGAPVARLNARDDQDALVKVGSSERGQTQIWWWRDAALVFGWVATSDLQKRPAPPGEGYVTGSGSLALKHSSAVIGAVRCNQDVPVIAEARETRATVGLIRAGTLIEVLGRNETEATVQTTSPFIATARGARLLVSASTLDACSAQ
jgi:hypothetical protein